MIKCFLLTILFSVNSHANIFVGNPGTAVDIGGYLYVSDLLSAGVATNPYIGTNIDPKVQDLPYFSFEVPENLLKRKLSDIEGAIPGFGTILLQTIKVLNWSLVNEELILINNDPDPIQLPPGAFKVQAANRFQTLVRINSKAWERLNDSHRVALIIHEAVYSLIIPEQRSAGLFFQSSQKARDLTGQLFLHNLPNSLIAKELMRNPRKYSVNVPSLEVPTLQRYFHVALGIGYYRKERWDWTITDYNLLNIAPHNTPQFYADLREACTNASQEARLIPDFDSLRVDLTVNWVYLQPGYNSYPASETETQIAIQYWLAIDTLFLSSARLQNAEDCISFGQTNYDKAIKIVQ